MQGFSALHKKVADTKGTYGKTNTGRTFNIPAILTGKAFSKYTGQISCCNLYIILSQQPIRNTT